MSTTYSISDLSREFDITTRAIRFYEDKGLLAPRRRGQTRIYSNSDRTRLKLILRGKRLGLSLQESREIIDMYHPGGSNTEQLNSLLSKIRQRKMLLQQQLLDIELMMADLEESETRCLQALEETV
ncbi:MerR family DNA-binding transcriptional regulator [Exilibacterium tricleocarpae]|uniref:MerR family DNA-binding transcriptional regulator n=1 Tax=Exilibacterium tricleocarpae TaxID=2591008 RepID=A0A545SMV0_9GAMM|nr:MerR family DNA-binding transcriptional regulator [Exilibacterium tricleocarpae]TQV66176.1 MerR family DNA-binding transcriptional regulator [Exilibacterium tricleocarpae]